MPFADEFDPQHDADPTPEPDPVDPVEPAADPEEPAVEDAVEQAPAYPVVLADDYADEDATIATGSFPDITLEPGSEVVVSQSHAIQLDPCPVVSVDFDDPRPAEDAVEHEDGA